MMKILAVLALAAMAVSCSTIPEAMVVDRTKPVYEIAVLQVKAGHEDQFASTRAAFLAVLRAQEGVSNDRNFSSFYSLPAPDTLKTIVGMTQYDTYTRPDKVTMNFDVMGKFTAFKDHVAGFKAYAFAQPIEGPAFDLSSLAKGPGQVLEVAFRRVNKGQEAAFEAARKAFVAKLGQQAGVVSSPHFSH